MLKNVGTIIIILFVFSGLFAQKSEDYDISAKKIEKKAYEKYIGKSDKTDYRYEKNTVVGIDEKIDGNIIVVDADLTVKGQVDGDILVILGKVKIENSAVINGNVTSIDGNIYQEEKSLINGNQIETKVKNLFPREEWDDDFDEDESRSGFRRYTNRYDDNYSTLPLGKKESDILLRYNRVQGFFLGASIPKSIGGKYNKFTLHGLLGYGFQEKRWNYEIGLDRWFFDQRDYRFELGVSAYDFTDTRDNWMITPDENSLAAFFLHKDFQDFYRRYG
ncbi:MAG TPA: polymer-forming cytoskeletal protein, partial [Caldithrix sp.]|nr:polymer-forming cytoskeletal protein [Caldithrix sp.]